MARRNNDFIYSRYTPLNYSQLNNINGHYSPSMVKSYNNQTFAYWERSLFQRACSIMDFDLPEEWEGGVRDFFYYCLFKFGYIGIFKDEKFGLAFQPGSPYGFDFYYQPTEFIVANPKLSKRFKIGKDCEILKLTPDYMGIWDIILYTAEKLSALDSAINMSIITNKFPFFVNAKTKAMAESFKLMFDKAQRGEPLIIADNLVHDDTKDKTEPFTFWERNNLSANYLTTQQLQDFKILLQNFDSEIGIPTLPYQKAERFVTDEANMQKIDGCARSVVWKATLESSLKNINDLFGTDIKVRFRYDPEVMEMEGGSDDGRLQNNPDRA